MKILRIILQDQLSFNISSMKDADKENDIIFFAESIEEYSYVKHHKKKIVFLISSMRHFHNEIKSNGYKTHYVKIDDPFNSGSITSELEKFVKEHNIHKIIVTFPGEYRILEYIKTWSNKFKIDVEIREDDRFLCSLEEFRKWSKGKKDLKMEFFYREMRKKFQILLDKNMQPIGGKWNYDQENRSFPNENIKFPDKFFANIDEITKEVIDIVSNKFKENFGDIYPFYLAVTRKDALIALEKFINERLYNFGKYQDAMIEGEAFMFHSHISFYLNIGLLDPFEVIKKIEKTLDDEKIPLNSIEGFIRQVIGWREYIRGIYWLKMPEYKNMNYLGANRNLPSFFWDGNTKMNCIKNVILDTKKNSYAHHIQRLMIIGNFSLITAIKPEYVNEWYMIVYADAFEWVELPNVTGMILYADGGFLGTKPYAASGSYINKMSNYCKNCSYKFSEKNGKEACPFNYLYWNFLEENKNKLNDNMRMKIIYSSLEKMSEDKKRKIRLDSEEFFKNHFN